MNRVRTKRIRAGVAGRAGWLVCAAIVLAIGGCTADYSAHLRNQTTAPITAKIMRDGGYVLAERFVGPGARERIGAVRLAASIPVYLEADSKSNPGEPARAELRPGKNVFNAVPIDDTGRIRLVEAGEGDGGEDGDGRVGE